MAEMKWTKEQQQVIDARGRNLLVSAAAGSGKTAVLVERIVRMVTDPDHPVDIDRLLVMTFTNAAAAEMRERIGDALEKRLEEEPGDRNLERQTSLIHHARITTIDSFCLKLLREHFNELDIDPGFRIGDEGELLLLQADVMKELLEDYYGREAGSCGLWTPTPRERPTVAWRIIFYRCGDFPRATPGRASGSPPVKKSFQRRQTGIWTDWRSQNGCGFWCRM